VCPDEQTCSDENVCEREDPQSLVPLP
jgi:hypothetical protein